MEMRLCVVFVVTIMQLHFRVNILVTKRNKEKRIKIFKKIYKQLKSKKMKC